MYQKDVVMNDLLKIITNNVKGLQIEKSALKYSNI